MIQEYGLKSAANISSGGSNVSFELTGDIDLGKLGNIAGEVLSATQFNDDELLLKSQYGESVYTRYFYLDDYVVILGRKYRDGSYTTEYFYVFDKATKQRIISANSSGITNGLTHDPFLGAYTYKNKIILFGANNSGTSIWVYSFFDGVTVDNCLTKLSTPYPMTVSSGYSFAVDCDDGIYYVIGLLDSGINKYDRIMRFDANTNTCTVAGASLSAWGINPPTYTTSSSSTSQTGPAVCGFYLGNNELAILGYTGTSPSDVKCIVWNLLTGAYRDATEEKVGLLLLNKHLKAAYTSNASRTGEINRIINTDKYIVACACDNAKSSSYEPAIGNAFVSFIAYNKENDECRFCLHRIPIAKECEKDAEQFAKNLSYSLYKTSEGTITIAPAQCSHGTSSSQFTFNFKNYSTQNVDLDGAFDKGMLLKRSFYKYNGYISSGCIYIRKFRINQGTIFKFVQLIRDDDFMDVSILRADDQRMIVLEPDSEGFIKAPVDCDLLYTALISGSNIDVREKMRCSIIIK